MIPADSQCSALLPPRGSLPFEVSVAIPVPPFQLPSRKILYLKVSVAVCMGEAEGQLAVIVIHGGQGTAPAW